MSKEDPKPGRWILPLVLAGIVGFTYVFVNAIPPAPVATTDGGGGGAAATTSTTAAATTTTTLDPVTLALASELDRIGTEGTDLVTEAQAINDRWDDGSSTFTASRGEFEAYRDKVQTFSDSVAGIVAPPAVGEQWQAVTNQAQAMATAASDMFDGFIDPESSAGRRDGHDALKAAAAAFNEAVNGLRTAVGG